jgi:hypothetical protein
VTLVLLFLITQLSTAMLAAFFFENPIESVDRASQYAIRHAGECGGSVWESNPNFQILSLGE